jgi:hypothetical protein
MFFTKNITDMEPVIRSESVACRAVIKYKPCGKTRTLGISLSYHLIENSISFHKLD